MHTLKAKALALPLTLLLLLPLAATAGYYEGYEAYARGDYQVALREWREVAEPVRSISNARQPDQQGSSEEVADARYAVGLLYWNGKGVERDYAQAAAWLRGAAEMNHAEAQLKLGYMHINGKGVPKDYTQAREWLSRSAQQGNVDAQYNLAVLYYKGLGHAPDPARARHWFEKAAAQGDKLSIRVLEEMEGPPPQGNRSSSGPIVSAIDQPSVQRANQPPRAIFTPPARAATRTPSSPSGDLHSPEWLATNPDSRYTIQLIAVSRKESLVRLARRFTRHGPFAYYTKRKGGQLLYVLVQGVFPSADQARAAMTRYPEELAKNRPFVTRIGAIRSFLP